MADRRRRVTWTPAATDALNEALAFIAKDDLRAAERVSEMVIDAAGSLDRLAGRGRRVPQIGEDDIREIFVFSYRLVYQVGPDEIRIVAFIHGARDFGRLVRDRKR